MSSSNFKNEFAQILIIFWFPAHVCMYDINIIAARDGEDKMTNGVGIDLILHDTILISLLADGSKDRIDCGTRSDMTWKCEESKVSGLV
jgi:hypothetical protein